MQTVLALSDLQYIYRLRSFVVEQVQSSERNFANSYRSGRAMGHILQSAGAIVLYENKAPY
jgi:hypothetical protein